MNFHILTLFPDMVMDGLNTSIIGRAVNAGLLSIEAVNIRDSKRWRIGSHPGSTEPGIVQQMENCRRKARRENVPALSISLPRGMCLTRRWRKNWLRRKT